MVRTLDPGKREAILEAAQVVFARDGFGAAKMTDIASAAKVAPGTLYLYFENKEALAGAIGEVFFARLFEQLSAIIKDIEGPQSIESLVLWALEIASSAKISLSISRETHHARGAKSEQRQRLVAELSLSLATLMKNGIIRKYDDANILAQLIVAILRRLLLSEAFYGDDDIASLKVGTITLLQHALFDDVSLAASRLIAAKQANKQL
jgi:AcrR family transcriptional regulator